MYFNDVEQQILQHFYCWFLRRKFWNIYLIEISFLFRLLYKPITPHMEDQYIYINLNLHFPRTIRLASSPFLSFNFSVFCLLKKHLITDSCGQCNILAVKQLLCYINKIKWIYRYREWLVASLKDHVSLQSLLQFGLAVYQKKIKVYVKKFTDRWSDGSQVPDDTLIITPTVR